MSEPTYRVDLSHDPSEIDGLQWAARIFRVVDDERVFDTQWGASREDVFERVQSLIRRASSPPDDPSTVFLTEDGDILDPHEVQR